MQLQTELIMKSVGFVSILFSLFARNYAACMNDGHEVETVRILLGLFIPQCENGVYAAEQCHYGFSECWCVTETGDEIPKTRLTLKRDSTSIRKRDCEEERKKFVEPKTTTGNNEQILQSDTNSSSDSEHSGRSRRATLVRSLRQAIAVPAEMGNHTETGAAENISQTISNASGVNQAMGQGVQQINQVINQSESTSNQTTNATLAVSVTVTANQSTSNETQGTTGNVTATETASLTMSNSTTTTPTSENATGTPSATTPEPGETATGTVSITVSQVQNATTAVSTAVTAQVEISVNATATIVGPTGSSETSLPTETSNTTEQSMGRGETAMMSNVTTMTEMSSEFPVTEMTTPESLAVAQMANETCGPNTVYSLCASACPTGCDNPEEEVCQTISCTPGCMCAYGYIRTRSNDTNSPCIKQTNCGEAIAQPSPFTQNQTTVSPAPRCPDPNAAWSMCGSPCEETCHFRPQCPNHCAVGCFCKEGFVKESNDSGAVCVPKDQCVQAPQPYQQQCQDPNAVLSNCGTACEETCDHRPTTCPMQCVSGCFCKDGFVKETKFPNAKCVRRNQCGQMKSRGPLSRDDARCLDPNSSWSNCGTSCQETCKILSTYCTTPCVAGCFCNEGFVKRVRSPRAKCVPRSTCQQQRKLNMP